jgi:nitrate/nitrite-specific signal transduction histidine kinase
MNERAQQLGAVLQFITSPGRGTRVVMKVMVKKEEEQNHAHQSVTG